MLLAYIENGNTLFYNIPKEKEEFIHNNIDFISKYDIEDYRIGNIFTSTHARSFLDIMPVDTGIVVINKYKKFEIDKNTITNLFTKFENELINAGHQIEVTDNKRFVAYEKNGEYLLFCIDNNIDRRNKNELYRKYYLGSFAVNTYTSELLSSMQVKLVLNEEKTKTTIKM